MLFKSTTIENICAIINEKKHRTDQRDFFVVIKPSSLSTFKNAVNIMDEMTIDGVKRYAMVEIDPVEEKIIGSAALR